MQRRFLLGFLCLALVLGLWPLALQTAQAGDGDVMTHETPERSGGSYRLHRSSADVASGPYLGVDALSPASLSPAIGTTFDGFNYDDNATENGGYVFIPPDPMGAAGTDRLIAVVNVMIEARSKTGSLLWRDGLETFFSSLSPPSLSVFDPKVIYDHYENRFLVVVLEAVDAGANPNAGNTSRILLAVSKTATPATATTADWYYTAINSEESIGPPWRDYWADYPGFEVDEEAVYITGNMFRHAPLSGYGGSRLWIVNKGVASGFYAGGAASATRYNPYAGGGNATTTMPAQVYGTSGIGGSGGTYLVSHSGLYYLTTRNEVVQVVRVNDPLGSPTFSQQYIDVGNIDNQSGGLPDAPQLGSATDIEVNDRRALDAVWRNNKLWLTTTINPNSGPDAGETTAHWFRLDTSAAPGGAITFDDQGNIGGEDIATATYTFFPSLAVNNNGDAKFGFSASAATIYAGAYAAVHLNGDAASTVRASETVRAGVDYYVRKFGGTLNRWGDYTGAALDPTDDNVVWLFNQYAMTRGSSLGGEDGRWGTAWASNLFITWDSYRGNYGDSGGTQDDYFADFSTEHVVYMYGTGFNGSYKVIYWDGATKRMVDSGLTSSADGKLKSQYTFDPGQADAGDWHVVVYTSSADPSLYSASDSNIVADDTSYTGGYAFHLEQSAIPEFPTALAAIMALALSAGVYLWMRRKAAPVSV